MTDATSSEEHSERQAGKVPRRRFLRLAGLGVAAAASAGGIYDLLRSDEPADKQPPLPALRGKIAPNPNLAQRTLVVIELTGGNDGLNTVAPLGDGRYHDLRPNVALAATDVVDLGDGMGLHRGLAPLLPQLALLQGVGASASDLSHFEMMQRWWRGDPDGRSNESSGFLGRCCDVVSVGQPIVGVTIGSGASPALLAERASTLGLTGTDVARAMGDSSDREAAALREGFLLMSGVTGQIGTASTPDVGQVVVARSGLGQAINIVDLLGSLPAPSEPGYQGGQLANHLTFASRLLRANVGVRIIHIPWGDFDTHEGQRGRHDGLLTELGAATTYFLADMERSGRAGDVLVATTSEFGRRPQSNASGTDHGTASLAMVAGPVVAGLHGAAPSLRQLDDQGNLIPTTNLAEYYATLAAWLGVPANEVLQRGTWSPIPGVLSS